MTIIHPLVAIGTESLLWVDKYAPKSTKHLIGQQGDRSNAKKLARWLQDWERNHGGGGGGEKAGKKPSGGKLVRVVLL